MKTKYLKSILPAALLTFAASCTDLDVDIQSQYTEFPDSELASEARAANAYYAMRGPLSRDYNHAQSLSSDEVTPHSYGANDYYDNGRYTHMFLHSWTPDDPCIGYWETVAGGITTCNNLIAEFGDAENVAPTIASLRAVRAYYFFVLMDSYGDVPLLDHKLADDERIDRSPRADIARFIEKELLEVRDQLSEEVNASTYGMPTRWMADALLAKLYLNWAVYTCGDVTQYTPDLPNEKLNDLVAVCDEIIASGRFDLSDDYRSKFYPDNGYQIRDFIYAMPFDRETQQGMTYARWWTHRSGNIGFYGVDLPSSVGGIFGVTSDFLDLFCLTNDERNETIIGGPLYVRDPYTYEATDTPWMVDGQQVVLTRDIPLNPVDEIMGVDNTPHGGRSVGYRSIKFYMDLQTTAAQSRSQSNDVPIFRYADVLLMKAEAILRGATATNGDTPMSLINQIRDYVGAEEKVTDSVTLDDLLDERGREFADESWRRNDLIRFGKFEDDWGWKHIINPAAKTQFYRRIFPIPTGVMNTNTNWEQNPGY